METICKLSIEEKVACHLADLAMQLHKHGLMDPYQRVVEARDALLLILDEKTYKRSEPEKAVKKEESSVMDGESNPLAALERLPQDIKIRKSECVAA